MSPSDLSKRIETEARRSGFDLVGVTTPEPPPHWGVYEEWIAAGRHGEMGYLADERACLRRRDPLQILPECRSIVVLGMRYNPATHLPPQAAQAQAEEDGWAADPSIATARPSGRIASYAWGDDYHDVLMARVQTLARFIERETGQGVMQRGYTDTGPLLERDLAQRAGLGWIGKNTCLINPRMGSYFLLVELLLDLDLPPSEPFITDHCGSCTRCIEACPTACILPDRTIDARRCLSYLTIELKGPIPVALRPLTGEWIFGCDTCQQACPWNLRFARPASEAGFMARPGNLEPALEDELRLTPEDFNHRFKGSPVKRAKRRGYLRNVAVALGNHGRAESVPVLAQALVDPEALVRGHAAWALGCIGGQAAQDFLQAAWLAEDDPWVQEEMRSALERCWIGR